jgi:AraC-like DNA-binding protein
VALVSTMTLAHGILSDIFASRAVAQILDFFLDHKEFDCSPSEIAQKTKLSFRTVLERFKIWKRTNLFTKVEK